MRIVNGVFCIVLILFAVVQYNDPDFFLWGAIYGAGAIFAGIAAFRPGLFAHGGLRLAYLVSLIAALAGLVFYWPKTPQWWLQDVWWETETAREGMGMMIITAALLSAGVVLRRARRSH